MRALLLLSLLLIGCRYATEEHGDERFLKQELKLEAGTTTALEAVESLGAPSDVWDRGDELWFVWRFEEVRDRSLVLRYFGGRWLQGRMGTRQDSTLLLVFDRNDRLKLTARTHLVE